MQWGCGGDLDRVERERVVPMVAGRSGQSREEETVPNGGGGVVRTGGDLELASSWQIGCKIGFSIGGKG